MPHNIKPKSGSWDDALTEAQRWEAYDKFVAFREKWWAVAKWAAEEFGIEPPSRSGLYRFAARMKPLEADWRVRQSIEARTFAGQLARKAGQTDEHLVAAYETLAADAALQLGDAKKAALYTRMAIAIGEKIVERTKLELKARQVAAQEASVAERIKSDREKAVDALLAEAKGNAAAEAALQTFLCALQQGGAA